MRAREKKKQKGGKIGTKWAKGKDKEGKIVEFSMNNEMDGYVEVRKYVYDGQGRLVKMSIEEGAVLTYFYDSMDGKGNWTRLVIKSDNVPIGLVERQITY